MHKIIISVMAALVCLSASAKSETLSFTLDNSRTYPGTTRTIKVYIPEAYDGTKEACLAIMMDDIMYGLTDAMESLYSEGRMPLTIAIGVSPGRILDSDGNVIRYNRSNEFDRTDGVFASFLENEVIPEVMKLKTSEGKSILLSSRPEDRMVLGASSGAIAAFAAAWNRPDLFSRVYSIVGTYVPMRGSDRLEGIIRKADPQRIRVYLQDNDEDSWNLLFGSWYEHNLLMNSALEFAGYELSHSWDKGGHNGNNGAAHMKEALDFLWKGWPEKVGKGESGNTTLSSILDKESDWMEVKAGSDEWDKAMKSLKPVSSAVYPGGSHCAVIESGHDTWVMNYTLSPNGARENGEEFYYLYSPARSIAFDLTGNLYCATSLGIEICDQNGRVRVVLLYPEGIKADCLTIGDGVLYISGDGKIFRREIKRKGSVSPFKEPIPESEGQG